MSSFCTLFIDLYLYGNMYYVRFVILKSFTYICGLVGIAPDRVQGVVRNSAAAGNGR